MVIASQTTHFELTLEKAELEGFRADLRGKLLRPGEEGYDSSRRIFNAMIDRHPALIVKCACVSDVIKAVNFARKHDLLVSVKGGGHNVAGNAVCDGGMMIDLTNMKSIRVDPRNRTARAEPGVTWGEFDIETQAFGLATTGGQVSTTGIAGFTLGGGHGWLMGLYGRACDNMVSADVVTADGRLLVASPVENQDLYWGLRGGGGNFGIVTSFEFALHPISRVLGGILVHPLERAKQVIGLFKELGDNGPPELGLMTVLTTLVDGKRVAILEPCYAGSIEAGERLLVQARRFGPPELDLVKEMSYVDFQKLMDLYAPWGMHHYWKSGFLENLSDGAMDVIVEFAKSAPSNLSQIHLERHHHKACTIDPSETAFFHRGGGRVMYNLMIISSWRDPSESEVNLEWTRRFWESIRPFMSERVYVNFLSQEGDERVRAAYGGNYARLVALKRKYDPTNFFRMNQNIRP